MPGSIRLLVLDAFDLPEAIPDGEEVAVKVAVGAREFQTASNKTFGQKTTPWSSDFVFPVLNLRDNLVVMLLDKNGEIISKGEIDTPSIVEKGSFEIELLLNGGGNIHLSLSFVLTDEERRRIDTMRAAALKRREKETPKSIANPQTVQKESDSMSSDPFLSPKVGEPEKDIETYEASKYFSFAASQEPDESQSDKSDGNLQDTHQEPLESRGQDSSEESSGIGSISSQDSVKTSQTATDQMNPDFSATSEIPSQACSNSELEEQAASESSGESPTDLAEVNYMQPTSNSVKAKVKAFETTRPKGAIKQGVRPLTAELLSPSPRFKSSSRRNVGSEAEQEALPEEHLDLIDTNRTEDEELHSSNQTGGVDPFQIVSESNLAGDSEEHNYKQEKDCLPEREVKEVQSTLESVDKVDCVKTNERDVQKEKTLLTASKQKRRLINLHGVSKQVLNGAIVGAVSGAVLVAAGALLWARNPNKRNTSARHQIMKQRMRK